MTGHQHTVTQKALQAKLETRREALKAFGVSSVFPVPLRAPPEPATVSDAEIPGEDAADPSLIKPSGNCRRRFRREGTAADGREYYPGVSTRGFSLIPPLSERYELSVSSLAGPDIVRTSQHSLLLSSPVQLPFGLSEAESSAGYENVRNSLPLAIVPGSDEPSGFGTYALLPAFAYWAGLDLPHDGDLCRSAFLADFDRKSTVFLFQGGFLATGLVVRIALLCPGFLIWPFHTAPQCQRSLHANLLG